MTINTDKHLTPMSKYAIIISDIIKNYCKYKLYHK